MSANADTLPDAVEATGRSIPVYNWPADGSPRAVVQILHGLSEHAGRYARFAAALNQAGISVVAHNHRGHGPMYADRLGHFADRGGWDSVLGDVHHVRKVIAAQFDGVPHVLLGHSMGSYIAQAYAMRHPERMERLILSGSTWPNRSEVKSARALAWLLSAVFRPASAANLLGSASFGKFNKHFKPNRTAFDWLSRDEQEVDRYVEDPLCGAVSSNRLWYDLLGGLLEISEDGAQKKVPADIPILITGGELDPVGGKTALTRLAAGYHESGHPHVKLKLYPEARHEILNETNRDEVTADVLTWIESTL